LATLVLYRYLPKFFTKVEDTTYFAVVRPTRGVVFLFSEGVLAPIFWSSIQRPNR